MAEKRWSRIFEVCFSGLMLVKTRRRNFLTNENKIKESPQDLHVQLDEMFLTVSLLFLISDASYLLDNV